MFYKLIGGMKVKIIRLMVGICAVLIIYLQPLVPAQAQTETWFYYAVASQIPGGDIAILAIDPRNPDNVIYLFTGIMLPENAQLHDAKASPDGNWIVLLPSGPVSSFLLLNVNTREARSIAANMGLVPRDYAVDSLGINHPFAWSPDSRYMAFTSFEDGRAGIVVYDVYTASRANITTNKIVEYYDVAWSPNGNYLAMAGLDCSGGLLDCQVHISVYDQTTQTFDVAINAIRSGGDLGNLASCQLDWSPDNYFISFVSSCDPSFNAIEKELFVLDRQQAQIHAITSYTTTAIQPPDAPIDYPIRWARYDPFWVDGNTLLVSVSYAETSTDNILDQITSYNLKDNSTTILRTDGRGVRWARHPSLGYLAFGLVRGYYASSPLFAVERATFDTGHLNTIAVLPAGCDLSWSPDAEYLAYTVRADMNAECESPMTSAIIVDSSTGEVKEKILGAAGSMMPVGWIKSQPIVPPKANTGQDL